MSERPHTLPALLERAATLGGSRTFLQAEDVALSYDHLLAAVASAAATLEDIDRGATAPLAIGSRNLGRAILCWWGQAWRGGLSALLHSELRGNSLVHALNVAESQILVADRDMIERVLEVRTSCRHLRLIVGLDADPYFPGAGIAITALNELAGASVGPAPARPEDPCTLMFTSGTTGPAKAVVKSHRYETTYAHWAADGIELESRHSIWSCSPYAHTRTANATILAAASVGAKVVLGRKYRAERFWNDAAAAGVTHTFISSSLANQLLARSAAPEDRRHRLEVIHCLPAPRDPHEFMDRFGVRLTGQGYGSTEVYAAPQQLRRQDWTRPSNFAGRPHPLVHAIVCDEAGELVRADGTSAGELWVRTADRYDMFTGYYKDEVATAEAIQDGWFHTGDRFTWDDAGNLYFAGRAKDSIRYAGENVSAWEIETAVAELEQVLEAAAYGVPSDRGEEDIRLDLILSGPLDLPGVVEHLRRKLPQFMVPRYIAVRYEFPRTPSGKVQKALLRDSQDDLVCPVFDRVSPSNAGSDE